MQTILGAGGSIGRSLATALRDYTESVRLVSRHPKKVNEADELVSCDLTDAAGVMNAVQGSDIVYLVAGLPYRTHTWRAQWPLIMQNVTEACMYHNARLVFFDNVYMYDPAHLHHMTESTPIAPVSKKGMVRASILRTLMQLVQEGRLTAMVVRSADFYGPGVQNSGMMETVYKNFLKGKKAMWLGKADVTHSLTYVPDAARATALLGNTPEAYNETWHLPTEKVQRTGKDWIELTAHEMGTAPKYTTISPFMMKAMGLFVPMFRELGEMMYQYDRPYYFNCDKFTSRFPQFRVTSAQEGIRAMVAHDQKKIPLD